MFTSYQKDCCHSPLRVYAWRTTFQNQCQTLSGIVRQLPFTKLTDPTSLPAGTLSSMKLRDSAAKSALSYVNPVEYD